MRDFEEMQYLLQCLGVAIGHRGAHGDPLAQQIPIKRGAGPRVVVGPVGWTGNRDECVACCNVSGEVLDTGSRTSPLAQVILLWCNAGPCGGVVCGGRPGKQG